MTYLSRQEIFTKAYLGLKSQGFQRSVKRNSNRCLYRANENMKCAIGWCISDENYDQEFDIKSEMDSSSIDTNPDILEAACIDSINLQFATELQIVHDVNRTPYEMEIGLERFADEYGLEIPE